jgi:hypothetical protein
MLFFFSFRFFFFFFFFLPPHCHCLPTFPLLSALFAHPSPSSASALVLFARFVTCMPHFLNYIISFACKSSPKTGGVPTKVVTSSRHLFVLFSPVRGYPISACKCTFHHSFQPPSRPSHHLLPHLFEKMPPHCQRPVPACHSWVPFWAFCLQALCGLSSEPMTTLHVRCLVSSMLINTQ